MDPPTTHRSGTTEPRGVRATSCYVSDLIGRGKAHPRAREKCQAGAIGRRKQKMMSSKKQGVDEFLKPMFFPKLFAIYLL